MIAMDFQDPLDFIVLGIGLWFGYSFIPGSPALGLLAGATAAFAFDYLVFERG